MQASTAFFIKTFVVFSCQFFGAFGFAEHDFLDSNVIKSDFSNIPIIVLKGYNAIFPSEGASAGFRKMGTIRKLLRDSAESQHNMSRENIDKFLGIGGDREWTVPLANHSFYISQVEIECRSNGNGPIEWVYSGMGDITNIDIKDSWVDSNDNFKYRNEGLYVSTLILRNATEEMTGKYICRSRTEPEMFNSFHLFVPRASKPYLLERGRTINITGEANKQLVTLPCMVNNPDAKVMLFKKYKFNRLGLTIFKFQHQPFHIFDPRSGFVIDTSDRTGMDPYGTYICTSNYDIRDGTDRVKINLFAPPGIQKKADGATRHIPTFLGMGVEPMRNHWKRIMDMFNSLFI